MKVIFSCDNCKSPFVVDAELAGRTGRCRSCGHRMLVPAPSASERPAVSAGGQGAAGAVAAAAGSRPTSSRRANIAPQHQPASPANRAMGWRDFVTSQLGLKPVAADAPSVPRSQEEPKELESDYKLKPITEDQLPALRRRKPEPEDDDEPGSTYKLVIPRELRKEINGSGRTPQLLWKGYSQGIRSYRQFFNTLAKLSRWISKTSYSLSLICFILAIAGGMVDRHSLAVLGLSAIVLLNIVGLAGDAVDLVMLSFRKNPIQGALFLVPPMTVFYLLTDWSRYREAVGRMKLPTMMLCLVVVAYMFVPWLNGGKREATVGGRIEKAVESIEGNMGDSTSQVLKKSEETKDELRVQMDKAKTKLGDADENATTKSEDGKQKGATPSQGPATDGSNSDGVEKPVPNRGP